MSGSICIIDTSIFLNLLDVPGRNQKKSEVTRSFEQHEQAGAVFILSMATRIETGNHISRCGNGGKRRATAKKFCEAVKSVDDLDSPFKQSELPHFKDMLAWIDQFPSNAGKNKPQKNSEGVSFGDMSIIEEYKKCLKVYPMSEVFIWSLDGDLKNYHHKPNGRKPK